MANAELYQTSASTSNSRFDISEGWAAWGPKTQFGAHRQASFWWAQVPGGGTLETNGWWEKTPDESGHSAAAALGLGRSPWQLEKTGLPILVSPNKHTELLQERM